MPGRLGFLNFPFLSTLSLRRATLSGSSRATVLVFLSTLSLRRATGWTLNINGPMKISIHALLAESDRITKQHFNNLPIFLSTLSLRRATHYDNYNLHCVEISIHALLAESDRVEPFHATPRLYFYPRSPCGERRVVSSAGTTGKSFLSTLSLRRATRTVNIQRPTAKFLSTLSLRRATLP